MQCFQMGGRSVFFGKAIVVEMIEVGEDGFVCVFISNRK